MKEFPFLQPRESYLLNHPATHDVLQLLKEKEKISHKDLIPLTRKALEDKDEETVENHSILYIARLKAIGLLNDNGLSELPGPRYYSLNREKLKEFIEKADNLSNKLKEY